MSIGLHNSNGDLNTMPRKPGISELDESCISNPGTTYRKYQLDNSDALRRQAVRADISGFLHRIRIFILTLLSSFLLTPARREQTRQHTNFPNTGVRRGGHGVPQAGIVRHLQLAFTAYHVGRCGDHYAIPTRPNWIPLILQRIRAFLCVAAATYQPWISSNVEFYRSPGSGCRKPHDR